MRVNFRGHCILVYCIIVGALFQNCSGDVKPGEISYRYKQVFSGNFLVYDYSYTDKGEIKSITDYGPNRTYIFSYRPDGKLDSIGNTDYWKKFFYHPNGELHYFIGNQVTPVGYKGEYVFENGRVKEYYGYAGGKLESKFYYSYSKDGYVRVDSVFDGNRFMLSSTSSFTFYTDRESIYFPQRTPFSDEAQSHLPTNWMEKSSSITFNRGLTMGTLTSYEFDKYGRVVKQKFTGTGGQTDYEYNFKY
ncbi:MAG: hypothetical protein IM631_14400 [Cytophagales bacterium]|jgi:hypothetical protein|nr:hypothetical protein [Cytophagales bacterium]MCA6372560.1 hypothetical protein [Cytophagales bacterium]MCA6377668.1 hypothetical protein [Cytophagales bacterium]MCA6386210.1 hypothetical protein [Cytophagales bacterium]